MSHENNPILNSVRQRLWRQNKNWIATVIGDPGSGKSWSAMEIADYIEKGKFSIDRVFFKVASILEAIDEATIKKGQCIIFDEAGIGWKARAFMKKENQDMSDLFQVMRYMNFALIMTVPSLAFVDKHGRNLSKMIFMTRGINRELGICKCEVMHISYDHLRGKAYPKWPRIIKDGVRYKAATMNIKKPRQELIDEYEARKKAYAKEIIAEKRRRAEEREAIAEEDENKKKATCDKCDYEWFTKSKALHPGCPSCGSRSTTTKDAT